MSRERAMNTAADPHDSDVATSLARADALVGEGRLRDAIDLLRLANRASADPTLERRLAQVRYAAFGHLDSQSDFDEWPVHIADLGDDGAARIPEITRTELSADLVRRNLLRHGSVRVNNLFDQDQVRRFVAGIDQALEVRDEGIAAESRLEQSWYAALPLPRDEAKSLGRHWVAGSGGVLAADSPKLLYELFETFERVGLREVVGGYLGEQPVLSANKCTMRRVPLEANADWHQDGAFLGRGIRALNVWVALSDCGFDSPGIDLLPAPPRRHRRNGHWWSDLRLGRRARGRRATGDRLARRPTRVQRRRRPPVR